MNIKKIIKIAVIGSRDTDIKIMEFMFHSLKSIISVCKLHDIGIEFRSGGALNGPDDLIRQLALEPDLFNESVYAKVYLPNKRKLHSMQNYPKQFIKFIVPDITDKIRSLVYELHPYPSVLKDDWLYEYHGRNLYIIGGDDLNDPVDCVYYSAIPISSERVKGGTGMGIAYANKLKIPNFNEYVQYKNILDKTNYNNYTNNKYNFKTYINNFFK